MKQQIWTISNILSLLRIVLVLPMTYSLVVEFPHHRWLTAGLILLTVATDFFDGYLARRNHEVTEVGKVLDPLADKIAIGVFSVVLVWNGDVPFWYVAVVLLRDVLILLGAWYIRKKKGIVPQSNWPGKVAVAFIAAYLFLATIQIQMMECFTTIFLWISVAFMVLSLAFYAQRLFIGRNIAG